MPEEIEIDVSTFDDDLLDLSEFAGRLNKFIEVEHNFVTGSLVLGLSQKFGSGKTTFLKMWKSSLENADSTESKPLVISLNAWESDYYGDPLFAIVSSLIEGLESAGESATSLTDAAKKLGWYVTAIGNQIAHKVSGIDPVAAGDIAEKKTKGNSVEVLDSFSIYRERKQAMQQLQKAIEKFVASSSPRVLFLVDELDRCRPDYAISYLETIKHIFNIEGAVFILAADRKQLENSARTAFGGKLDFDEYYRKFVHREISLPPITDKGFRKLANFYVKYYLERENLRYCFMEIGDTSIGHIVDFIAALKLTPRQIQEVFRLLGHILESSNKRDSNLRWAIAFGTIAMSALKVGSPNEFELFGSGSFDPNDAIEFLRKLFANDRLTEWWFILFLTGGGMKLPKDCTVEKVLADVGLVEPEKPSRLLDNFGHWEHGWGAFHSGSRLEQIREKFHQLSKW